MDYRLLLISESHSKCLSNDLLVANVMEINLMTCFQNLNSTWCNFIFPIQQYAVYIYAYTYIPDKNYIVILHTFKHKYVDKMYGRVTFWLVKIFSYYWSCLSTPVTIFNEVHTRIKCKNWSLQFRSELYQMLKQRCGIEIGTDGYFFVVSDS